MDKKISDLIEFFDLRKSLMLIILILGLIAVNLKWLSSLDFDLVQKTRDFSESRMLLESKSDFEGREKELDSFSTFTKTEKGDTKWADIIPSLVADNRLILRQIRPSGEQKKGQFTREEILVQVDGSIESFLGFLHALTALEKPIYVSRYLITARSIGSGFISAELNVVHLNLKK